MESSRFSIEGNTLRIGGLVFDLTTGVPFDVPWRRTNESFLMHKPPQLIRMFDDFFEKASLNPRNIFELGIWGGGSTAFWFEYFQPDKHVAIDQLEREDAPYFRSYVSERGLEARLKTYWGVDQADGARLREIVSDEFSDGLDLVLDDASHQPHPTRASFETLFPLLRPGGIYLIEDWAWEFHPSVRAGDHPWSVLEGLLEFVRDLVTLTGNGKIRQLTVRRALVAAERGR